MQSRQSVTIALAGQPNVGKSTVFNMLTGLNQHVGNWPGKTVEQRTGSFEHHGVRVEIVDLPGTYCLTAASPEEVVARDHIIHAHPDVVVAVISAASLERNLYLVAELLALPAPVVLGLNMIDVARQEGIEVQPHVLAAAIGIPVIPMVATRAEGVHELVDAALEVALDGLPEEPHRPEIRPDHQEVLESLTLAIRDHTPEPYPVSWVAIKLLEGDELVSNMMKDRMPPEPWAQVEAVLRQHEDAILSVASGRYDWIRRMTRAALVKPRGGRITLTQRLDSVATHPIWGLVVLAAVLAAIFGLTYAVGAPLQSLLEDHVVHWLATTTTRLLAGASPWLTGLVVDGIIGGVGIMLTFIPILVIFFISMGLLEDVGYMARAAYVMDRFMHAMGLHGKSFMPLFLGFGCNVPAIMGARIIESHRGRLLTMMLAPLVPCTGRLALLAVLVPIFFPAHPTLMSWALTGLPLVVLALLGVVASRFVLRDDSAAFIMEIPLYHLPNSRTIAILVWERVLSFLQKAGTTILAMSVVVWLLSTLPHGEIETSYLAVIGRFLEPLGRLMGLGWRPLVALFTSFVAKENSLAALSVLYGVSDDVALSTALSTNLSTAAGLAFLVAQMLFIPCVGTVAAIRQETNSWRLTLLNVALMSVLALVGGVVAYQLGMVIFA